MCIRDRRVLSGEEEATFARIGAGIADKPDWGLIDLGGGSCQLISEGFAVSAPMGCVRAKDICDKESDGSYESMREAVFKACEGLFRFPRIRITAVSYTHLDVYKRQHAAFIQCATGRWTR